MISSTLAALVLSQALPSFAGDRPTHSGQPCIPAPASVVIYGDSIAAGAGSPVGPSARLDSQLPDGWAITGDVGDGQPGAISGYTAAQIRSRYDATHLEACAGAPCGFVVAQGAVNSLKGGVSAAGTLATMAGLVDAARTAGYGVVWPSLLPYRSCTVPTCSAESVADAVEKSAAYNALWRGACAARPAVRCVDMYGDFESPAGSGNLRTDYGADDGIHLEQDGTNEWVRRVQTALLQLAAPCT